MLGLGELLRYCRTLLVLSAALCFVGCAFSSRRGERQVARTPPYELARPAAEILLVEALWSYHEAAITDVLRGVDTGRYRYDGAGGRDFDRALDFFESVTGIQSNAGTTFGRLITPELGATLDLWRQWYRENREQLRFDASHCEITY
jgi:hypothetical protein